MNMKKTYVQKKMIFPANSAETQRFPFYVTGVGSLKHQHPCSRPEGLVNYHFLYTTEGKGYVRIEQEEYVLSSNMGMYFRPGVAHEYYARSEAWTTYWVMFNGSGVDQVPVIQDLGAYKVFSVSEMGKLNLLYNNVYTCAESTGLLNIGELSVNLYHFLLELPSCIGNGSQSGRENRTFQVNLALAYLEEHYDRELTLEEIAAAAGISPQYLCRLFKDTCHMRPFEYLTLYRLKNAKSLLVNQECFPLKEIAWKVGFRDISYFCTVFKRQEGMTPTEFRKIHWKC